MHAAISIGIPSVLIDAVTKHLGEMNLVRLGLEAPVNSAVGGRPAGCPHSFKPEWRRVTCVPAFSQCPTRPPLRRKGVPLSRKWGCHWKADGSCGASSEQPIEATDFLPYSVGLACEPKTLPESGCHWKADGSCGASSEQPMEAKDFLSYSVGLACEPKTLPESGCHWKADGSCGASSEQPIEATDFLPYSVGRACEPKTLLESR
jgi:hypothetical protein